MNYKDDLKLAQLIVSNRYIEKDERNYNNSSTIYRGTNEWISSPNYLKLIENKKKILSIIASGDQILNSILLGSDEIYGYDISRFPKYYLYLKIAALKKLKLDDFLDFFVGGNDKKLSEDIYDILSDELPLESRVFWDGLFDYFDSFDLNSSNLLSSEPITRELFVKRNLYLQGDNYNKMKYKIDNVNIKLFDNNIFKLVDRLKNNYFDLINLSSIIHYPKDNFGDYDIGFERYRDFLLSLPLSDNGIAISYLYGVHSLWLNKGLIDKYYSGSSFQLIPISNTSLEDGILVYKKR